VRVLLVTSTFPRWQGDETTLFILHLAQELRRQGVAVDVLAPHAPGAAVGEEIEGVPVERFRYFVPESGEDICYAGGALFNLKRSPLRVAKLPVLVGAEVGAIARRARRREYDVISAHWLLPQGWAAIRGGRGTPVVTTVHGSDVFGLRHPLLRAFKRSALRGSSAVTVNSSATRDAVESLVTGLEHLLLVPMGVDLTAQADPADVSRWRQQLGSNDGPLIAYVGRLIDWKGVDDLLDATALLRHDLPGLRLTIAGTGPLTDSLQERSRRLGISDVVTFAGWLDRGQVTALESAADVVVAPSRKSTDGSREAQGLSIVEAMSLGRPVIAGRVGGIPDAIQDGVNGLLVPERDPQAIAQAVRRVWSDRAFASKLGEAAAARARDYAWPTVAGRFVEIFDDAIARSRRS
jgi:glycosyltransferase involved in cell wall biosynthesis